MHEATTDVGEQSDDALTLAISLGAAIRAARKGSGLTLQALAQRTGLSQSFLSQSENGHTVPSILNLHTIARSLGTTAHELLSPSGEEVSLVRASDGPLFEASPGATMRRCARRSAVMAANEITAGPATSASSPTEHAGEEFVYVIDGELEVEVGTTTYSLAPGDVLYYASTIPHRWHNRADRPARFLITSSPPF